MPAVTPEFLFDLESNMRQVSENEYQRLLDNLWWQQVAKPMDSGSKKERIDWLLETAMIERPSASHGGGEISFEDIVSNSQEFEVENANAGLKLKKEQFEDLDGNGIDLASHWARQMGAYAAYWPQKQVAEAIKANPVTYDGKPLFVGNGNKHLVNPFRAGAGDFANHFTGAAAGSYPGALPVSGVTVDVALENLQAALAYIAAIKMPNGEDPRGLRIRSILCPPALTGRFAQLTDAKFIAQAASSGGGSGDVEALIRRLGLGTPVEAPELAGAFGGSDTDYYLLVESITTNQLGALVYVDREPFGINYHGPMTDAELARLRHLQWTTEGRNTVGAGHPYLIFKCSAT